MLIRLFLIISIFSILIVSCEKDPDDASPIYNDDYGSGLYILTDQGVNYYDYNDTTNTLSQNIFSSVNGISINNPKKIRILGSTDLTYLAPDKAFILADNLYIVDLNTFQILGEVNDIGNPTYCEVVSQNRVFVSDSSSSKVKEIDLKTCKVISEIETGESTKPGFIINKGNYSFVLNSGNSFYIDSSIVAIQYRDLSVPMAEFSASIIVGENPISSVSLDNLGVLCKGVFSENNPAINTESSFFIVQPFSFDIVNSVTLNGVYNAQSLVKDYQEDELYFTCSDGVYKLNYPSLTYSSFLSKKASVLEINVESYSNTDSTTIPVQMIYMNDIENPGYVFKYNTFLSSYTDSLYMNGNVIDLQLK